MVGTCYVGTAWTIVAVQPYSQCYLTWQSNNTSNELLHYKLPPNYLPHPSESVQNEARIERNTALPYSNCDFGEGGKTEEKKKSLS